MYPIENPSEKLKLKKRLRSFDTTRKSSTKSLLFAPPSSGQSIGWLPPKVTTVHHIRPNICLTFITITSQKMDDVDLVVQFILIKEAWRPISRDVRELIF